MRVHYPSLRDRAQRVAVLGYFGRSTYQRNRMPPNTERPAESAGRIQIPEILEIPAERAVQHRKHVSEQAGTIGPIHAQV